MAYEDVTEFLALANTNTNVNAEDDSNFVYTKGAI